MATSGFLGIDCGTQGLSVIYTDEKLNVLAVGEGAYDMVPGLGNECYEQNPNDWLAALKTAMRELREELGSGSEIDVLAIGISGQMHGEVHADGNGEPLGPARLWCDGRNEAEGHELTARFGVKMPKRATATRWLWTIRNQHEKATHVRHITTPAGWLSYCLTGRWTLGVGDAAGMFPIDQQTLNYNEVLLGSFDDLVSDADVKPLRELLPAVRVAGADAGVLSEQGADLLGLPAGIKIAPAEGDQPAALAGSLIGAAGLVSCSFGTSVCANSVGDRAFEGVSEAVDHFCAPDGKPINMVCLRNGTTYMNSIVGMFGQVTTNDAAGFATVMPMLLDASPDCGGLLAMPFMDDEPGLGVSRGGTAMIVGLNSENATPGNVAKAALLSTMFNLRLGSEDLDAQGFPRNEIVLTGGLTKTPELAQILADVFDTTVTLLDSAEEGTAWGAALMAKYRHVSGGQQPNQDWAEFLSQHAAAGNKTFSSNRDQVGRYEAMYKRYKRLVATNGQIDAALLG